MQRLKSSFLLVLTALIWGNGFIAQFVGMESIGPWTFTFLRSLVAGITLFIMVCMQKKQQISEKKHYDIRAGIFCGIALCIASILQQIGIQYTTVGKAGFLTALYTVLVPLFAVVLGRKIKKSIWAAVLLAVAGLYFLSGMREFSFGYGDIMVLLCAAGFAVHILVIDHFSKADGYCMSCVQFFTVAALTIIPSLIIEHPQMNDMMHAVLPILYAGVFSSGIAYTLQIIGQKNIEPEIAGMLLSLESVFAALSGYFFLHQMMSVPEIIGCVCIFIAILAAQIF